MHASSRVFYNFELGVRMEGLGFRVYGLGTKRAAKLRQIEQGILCSREEFSSRSGSVNHAGRKVYDLCLHR